MLMVTELLLGAMRAEQGAAQLEHRLLSASCQLCWEIPATARYLPTARGEKSPAPKITFQRLDGSSAREME